MHGEEVYGRLSLSSVSCHLPGDSGLLTGDDLAARWLVVDCAAPSRSAADISALILAAGPTGGSGDPDSRTRKLNPEDDVGACRPAESRGGRRLPSLRHVSSDGPAGDRSRWPARTTPFRTEENRRSPLPPPPPISPRRTNGASRDRSRRTALNYIPGEFHPLTRPSARVQWGAGNLEGSRINKRGRACPAAVSILVTFRRLVWVSENNREGKGEGKSVDSDGEEPWRRRNRNSGGAPRRSGRSRVDGPTWGARKENGIGFWTWSARLERDSGDSGARRVPRGKELSTTRERERSTVPSHLRDTAYTCAFK